MAGGIVLPSRRSAERFEPLDGTAGPGATRALPKKENVKPTPCRRDTATCATARKGSTQVRGSEMPKSSFGRAINWLYQAARRRYWRRLPLPPGGTQSDDLPQVAGQVRGHGAQRR